MAPNMLTGTTKIPMQMLASHSVWYPVLINKLLKGYVKQNVLLDQTSLYYEKQHGLLRLEKKC